MEKIETKLKMAKEEIMLIKDVLELVDNGEGFRGTEVQQAIGVALRKWYTVSFINVAHPTRIGSFLFSGRESKIRNVADLLPIANLRGILEYLIDDGLIHRKIEIKDDVFKLAKYWLNTEWEYTEDK